MGNANRSNSSAHMRARRSGGGPEPYRVFYTIGILMLVLTALMIPPMVVDLVSRNRDWNVFMGSGMVTGFIGLMLILISRDVWSHDIRVREGFLLTVSAWFALSVFASIPYLFLDRGMSFTDAWFETVSGLTTTGSTVLSGLDTMPPGILLWRSLTQWIGGVGIVVMALIMLPFLKIGGMQLFQTESSDRSDKIVPQARQFIGYLALAYGVLTALCAAAYWLNGMSGFDAVNHALTTISTGGFSTHDASMGYFHQPSIHWLATLFMFASSLPLVLYVRAAREGRISVFRNQQVISFAAIVVAVTLVFTLWRIIVGGLPFAQALREVAFNVVGIISTTGYALGDFTTWGAFAVTGFFALMFLGGCTGSTAGGMKVFRLQVMLLSTRAYLKKLVSPHRVVPVSYEGHTLTQEISMSVFAFVSVLLATVLLFSVLISMTGVDFVTAFSSSVTAVTNVGPGLGNIIGPSGNFSSLPDAVKILLAFAMLLGRLEFFSVLVVLSPAFWK